MSARPSTLPGIMIGKIEGSKNSLFRRNLQESSFIFSLCETAIIDKISGRAEHFLGS